MTPSWRRLWVRGRRLPFDPWKAVLAVVLAVAVVVVLGWTVLGSRLLVVRNIEVVGERLVNREEVVAAAGIRLGTPLMRVDRRAVQRRVGHIRQVLAARVERAWPSTLRIRVTERSPVAAVDTGSGYALVDRVGVVVTVVPERPEELPMVEDPGLSETPVASAGPVRDPAVRAALAVAEALPADLAERVTAISADTPSDVTLGLRSGDTVVWGTAARSPEKARTLLTLLSQGTDGVDTYDVSSPGVATVG